MSHTKFTSLEKRHKKRTEGVENIIHDRDFKMFGSKVVILIFVLSAVLAEDDFKKCADYFDFVNEKLVLVKNEDFVEKIDKESVKLDVIVGKGLNVNFASTLKLFECKKNNPNDSTLCKYQVGSKSFGKIQSAYHNGNLVCGPAEKGSQKSRSRRATEEITCGESAFVPEVKSLVKGGSDFKPGSWPWMAALFNNLQFICGGSIISERVILTSAHCIQDKSENEPISPEQSNFVVGKHNLKARHEKGFKIMAIERFVMNPGWKPNRRNYDADIAVAILQTPLTYQHNIKPICLGPETEATSEIFGLKGVVAGWGYSEEKSLNVGIPRIVEIPIINDDTCIEENDLLNYIMTYRTFCTAGNLGKV
jgi:hypothetical protein